MIHQDLCRLQQDAVDANFNTAENDCKTIIGFLN